MKLMDKISITITGEKVQDLGYRVSLLNSALTSGADKFNAQNTYIKDKQAVIIHVGAEKEIIDEYYKTWGRGIDKTQSLQG